MDARDDVFGLSNSLPVLNESADFMDGRFIFTPSARTEQATVFIACRVVKVDLFRVRPVRDSAARHQRSIRLNQLRQR